MLCWRREGRTSRETRFRARSTKTTTISTIDRASCKTIEQSAIAELEAMAARLGLVVRARGGSFVPGAAVTIKFEFALDKIDDATGVRVSTEAENYKRFHMEFGLDISWLGREYMTSRGPATIVGLMPRRSKMPVLVELADGRRMKTSPEAIIAQLRRPAAAKRTGRAPIVQPRVPAKTAARRGNRRDAA